MFLCQATGATVASSECVVPCAAVTIAILVVLLPTTMYCAVSYEGDVRTGNDVKTAETAQFNFCTCYEVCRADMGVWSLVVSLPSPHACAGCRVLRTRKG